jgi:1,2-diacylglycerol 3-alpha-glucosyltransferase
VRVFFPCTGLGRQRRGFETFTLECAQALAGDPQLDLRIFAGGAVPEVAARVIANFPRDSRAARWLSTLHGRGAYFSEQLSFFFSFLPHLMRGRPDVVYFADLNLGNLCWHWRQVSRQDYRLLFYNGGLTTMPFTRADLIQQLTPQGMDEAIARGEDPARQVLLPHGVMLPHSLPSRIVGEERAALGLPAHRAVILSVGMLDSSVKRMDYLIREVAALPAPRPFLVVLGAESPESDSIRALATSALGEGNYLLTSVEKDAVSRYYRAADVFALASIREGFGLAYIEAVGHGLPVIAHDFAGTRYLLENHAVLADLTQSGALRTALEQQLATPDDEGARVKRHRMAYERFSWSVLKNDYSAMLRRAASLPIVRSA